MLIIDSFSNYYRFLSNFYLVSINFEGENYPSVENAYQAQKTLDLQLRKKFINITPSQAKRLGNKIGIISNWNECKFIIMKKLCEQKFYDNKELTQKLIDTFPAILIEGNTWGDTYWGKCNNIGENNLGKILMEIRDELIKESTNEKSMETNKKMY